MNNHPFATLTKDYPPSELDRLTDSIRRTGRVEPVKVFKGRIVCGRHRWKAAQAAGWATADIPTEELPDDMTDNDLRSLIIADEDIRRHNGESDRYLYIARMYDKVVRDDIKAGPPKKKSTNVDYLTIKEVAQREGIDETLLGNAFRVLRKAETELQAVIEAGYITNRHAVNVLDSPPEEQKQIAEEVIRDANEGFYKGDNPAMRARNRIRKQAQEIIPVPPTPDGKYDVIVIDPPWPVTHAPMPRAKAGPPYPTMTLEEIAELDIPDLAADDAWVFLWTTNQFVPAAVDLLEDWDLGYRGLLVWKKNLKTGTQYGWRMNAEFVVVGRKGKPKFDDITDFQAVNAWKAGKHSAKPAEFYDLIERVCGPSKRLDMFARRPLPGWEVWGKEA